MSEQKIEQITVKIGQVWQDNDPRLVARYGKFGDHIRLLEVTEIEHNYAFARVTIDGVIQPRKTKIRLDRFKPTSTGYRLIKDVD
jgi:hypothetical protein